MKALSYFIIILFTPTLILLNYRFLVFNQNFYEKEYALLSVYQKFENRQLVNDQSSNLIKYLCCNKPLNTQFYTQREILHLADVKNLILLTNSLTIIFLSTLILSSCYLLFKKQLKTLLKTYQAASIIAVAIIFILYLSSRINFSLFFTNFHYLSFRNDYWLLSEDSSLIKLFPQKFFADFANRVAAQTFICALIIDLFTYLNLKKHAFTKR
ncbi:MAG: hypothetical protein A2684_00980 [Candidatus Levybacteria bacterium RIFCSPHIGHO2_01_FULL_36_15b]|nr:MAG: hypothetical protein A2684_00980 [Candidatus Levybacteria bacterium RIFCSPHIGHO2_01_FULL_36_15b]